MNLKYSFAIIIVSSFLFACGEDVETEEIVMIDSSYITSTTSEADLTEAMNLRKSDVVAFKPPDSDTIMVINLAGEIIGPHTEGKTLSMQWPEKELIISRICGSEMESDKRVFNFFSPDGGTVDISVDEWFPPMKSDQLTVAVACKPVDEDSELIIVTDDSTPGNRSDWSRSGRGELSDGVNIYLVSTDGSRVHSMTYLDVMPDSGEWLPQWSPNDEYVVYESNGTGNSEIVLSTVSTGLITEITRNGIDDWNPVWSRDGNFIVWERDVGIGPELVALGKTGGEFKIGGLRDGEFYVLQRGTPVPWNTWGE